KMPRANARHKRPPIRVIDRDLAAAIAVEAIDAAHQSLQLARAFRPRRSVLLGFEEALFPAKLVIARKPLRVERSVFGRSADRATWFALVTAVAEAALLRQRRDVGKHRVQAAALGATTVGVRCSAAIPELQLAHSRRINDDASFGNEEHLPRRRRVASLAVG